MNTDKGSLNVMIEYDIRQPGNATSAVIRRRNFRISR
jgi:hypothetical protein